ncbi:uncharacterized protein LOC111698349 [Eurytemora carolleeae]|uniref:uncharacterized protein LOC111698349 n=1 Tax=Eurytemora carolleeae TaxID=1294199 RepID=UPI000C7919B4|nr:uncharacterized protein LOC111698349 [Eurytemora carolleeae]|eukprot:XP_023324431.1 uncharacterized protein LOC111698349 [Eurytemora affinis]
MLSRTSNTPNFRLGKLEYKKTLSLSIYSSNSKGRSEEVRLPDLKSDFLLENGPITRAAKNTEIKGEEDEDESVGEVRQENLMSIVLGVSAALVIILLVILITMSIRCGRDSNRNWGARDSGGSTSPDYLVNADPDGEFQCHGTRSISTGSITSVSPHPISATGSLPLPRRNHAPALLTLQSLPPPPPPPSGKIDPALLNDDQCTDLSPPPEWASTLLPPPDSFFTLPRKGEKLHNRSVRFEKQVHSRSITSLDNIHKSNSHVESIV